MRNTLGRNFSWVCLALMLGAFTSVLADPMTIKLTLVWGTDEEKPKDTTLKPADPQMVTQFHKICKWKHYFEVTNTTASLSQTLNRVRLSPKCEIEVQNLGKEGLEAKFFGEGKLIYKGKSKVEPGKHWGIAGEDKDATAWFVILTPL